METATLMMFVLLTAIGGVLVVVLRAVMARRTSEPDQSVLMLAQRLDALHQQVTQQLEQSRQASEQATRSVFSQVQSFTQGMTELRETVHRVQESVKDVSSFQEMFRSPKLRGTWGELTLGAILREYFPHGGFEEQYGFASGEIVDAVLKLPNDLLLPIDSKFSWENFKKMTEAEGEAARQAYRKAFVSDVKKRIDEIATKYILPGEGTVDMALMYMPAESIYYEVIQNVTSDDIAEYARKRKVYLASPNTLYITLSAVIHWFKDVQLQKQTRDIMKKLETVIKDAGTLATDFRKLGDHLSDAQSAFERSDKKLGHLVERTQKVIELADEAKQLE
ncbi:MAG: DNA recombination protein RmuC [Candidatus Yanofskybacteria bacterium]|nr:DNA recombination protein RmuC [Candidatus Yanofskybacteria bacterium]